VKRSVACLSGPVLKDRIGELKATRDQAHLDGERALDAIERAGPRNTSQARAGACAPIAAATAAITSALTQRVEVDQKELRFMEPARLAFAGFFAPAPRRSSSLKTCKFPAKSRFVRILDLCNSATRPLRVDLTRSLCRL
jgi:hypothetical protein